MTDLARTRVYVGERARMAVDYLNGQFDRDKITREGMVWRVPRTTNEHDAEGAKPCLYWNDDRVIMMAEYHAGSRAAFHAWIEHERRRTLP